MCNMNLNVNHRSKISDNVHHDMNGLKVLPPCTKKKKKKKFSPPAALTPAQPQSTPQTHNGYFQMQDLFHPIKKKDNLV